jgi:hypothetical protein
VPLAEPAGLGVDDALSCTVPARSPIHVTTQRVVAECLGFAMAWPPATCEGQVPGEIVADACTAAVALWLGEHAHTRAALARQGPHDALIQTPPSVLG